MVAERGALPGTIYFDADGLCVESNSYKEDKWNHPISEAERQGVDDYMSNLRFGEKALEKQDERINANELRLKLGIQGNKKILFVPLQLSDDTVTSYFSEAGRGYADYLEELKKLACGLPEDWVMVYKKHPLALNDTDIPNAIIAGSLHINDLLEAANAVALFNSGTGMIAMAFGKPVFYYGKCFYAIDGVNYRFEDATTLSATLAKGTPDVDHEKCKRFYSYIINRLYSFAEWHAEATVATETSMRSRLQKLRYHILRIPGYEEKRFGPEINLPDHSILFDRYRNYWQIKGKKTKYTDTINAYELDKKIKKKISYKVFAFTSARIMSPKKAKKLHNFPSQFFLDSQSSAVKWIGRRIAPEIDITA